MRSTANLKLFVVNQNKIKNVHNLYMQHGSESKSKNAPPPFVSGRRLHTYKFKIHRHMQEISNEALRKFRFSPNDEEEQTGNFWWTGKRSVGVFPPEFQEVW